MNLPTTVQHISECFIKPKYTSEESKQPIHLSPWDLAMLSVHYIQKGLLFPKPPSSLDDPKESINNLLTKLKESLSLTLVHFYPLSGRLATHKQENPHSYVVYIDCDKSPGARFIHASVDLTISDILEPVDVPLVVQSLFDHDRAVNHDGHTMSLLTIQLTELIDGIFIGCSINHMAADGTSFWHFLNVWSEIFQAKTQSFSISRPTIHKHWFPEGHGPFINLPFTHYKEFISRLEAPLMRERIFHCSSESLAKLKAKANAEYNTNKISTLQALSALLWRCVTRARGLPYDRKISCRIAINNRSRLEPPLPNDYFGNSIQTVRGITTAGELLEHGLGWAAWLLHEAVANHTDKMIQEWVGTWLETPFIYQLAQFFDPNSIMLGSSPRFDMYGNQFGLGKAVALRSGYANKFDGKVTLYPGREGGGSMDLEICLFPEFMRAIELDDEFINGLCLPN